MPKLSNHAIALFKHGVDLQSPHLALLSILEAALELVLLPENDFSWSSWENADDAQAEIQALIATLRSGGSPEQRQVSILFAVTGPLQELSMSSGWSAPYLQLAQWFDQVEALIWPPHRHR